MGYASHRQERRRQAREEAERLRAESRALPHMSARASAWQRTVGGIVSQMGGTFTLEDTHAESVRPIDHLQVTHDDERKTTTFTLIRGESNE
jgi:hypothetical protein